MVSARQMNGSATSRLRAKRGREQVFHSIEILLNFNAVRGRTKKMSERAIPPRSFFVNHVKSLQNKSAPLVISAVSTAAPELHAVRWWVPPEPCS